MSETDRPKRARRGRGEGAVYQRSDGYWCGVHQSDYRRRVVYAPTKTDVLKKLDRIRQAGDSQEHERLTLEIFLDRWLSEAVEGSVRPATHALYSSIVKKHIKPKLGAMRVRKLTPDHVSKMLADLEKAGVSARVRQIALFVLHRALRQAMRWEIVVRNVCELVNRPRSRRREIHALTDDQITALLDAAVGDRYHALYVVALATGMRIGELLGLQWVDFDEELGLIQVRRQLVRRPNAEEDMRSTELAEPKTSVGRRRIDLPTSVVKVLANHKAAMAGEGHAELRKPIFCTKDGFALHYNNLINRSFVKLLEKAELPRIRFHDLRHTHASQLLRAGVHPKVVSERLGHARVGFTLDTYSHLLPSMQRDAADRINAAFEPAASRVAQPIDGGKKINQP